MDKDRLGILTKIARIVSDSKLDENGTCRNPGRTEGESIETLYYDAQYYENDAFGDQETTGAYRVFEATPIERSIFGADKTHYVIAYTSDGFLYGDWRTADYVDALREEVE